MPDGYPQNRMPIPFGADIIRDRTERYCVWKYRGRLWKQQPKYLTDNEMAFLTAMQIYGARYVPNNIVRHDIETISMDFIINEPVTNSAKFMAHFQPVIDALREANIRHGDLTEYAVLVRENAPVLIDFSESRWFDDPMPSKRREPDSIMLMRTMRKLCKQLT